MIHTKVRVNRKIGSYYVSLEKTPTGEWTLVREDETVNTDVPPVEENGTTTVVWACPHCHKCFTNKLDADYPTGDYRKEYLMHLLHCPVVALKTEC